MENYYLGNGRRWSTNASEIGIINESLVEKETVNSDKNIPDVIRSLLIQRGIKSREEMQAFINPSLEELHDPFLLEGMEIAVDRIIKAISNNERILIYGDYDADGVSATSILLKFFKSLNIQPEFYIPDRVDEGYGISDIAVDYIVENEFNLVITVDCGISGRKQIDSIYEKINNKGKAIDIIITDHHQCNDELIPEALSILNPHLPGSKYPFKYLCGAGVALKLVQALGIRLNMPKAYEEYLDIAAIATIADIVSLTGENRIIAKFGIEKIISAPCTGVKSLLKVSLPDAGLVDSYRLSFILAPRINAAGRMGDASVAVKLFTTDNEAEAEKLAILLNQSNTRRQQVQDEIYKEALEIIESDTEYKKQKVLVVYKKGWHHGVIGIVASKLVDRYHKPTFVISIEEDKTDEKSNSYAVGKTNGYAIGSGRSIQGFNLFKAMEAQADILVKFGGHEQAGGLKIHTNELVLFRKRINDYAGKIIVDDMLIPETSINLEINGKDINLKMAKLITYMKPFGSGNEMPVFCFRGAVILGKKTMGDGKHLKVTFGINGQNIEGVFFGKGSLDKGLFVGDKVDIIFTLDINVFRGNESLQIKLIDMRLTESVIKRNQLLHKAALGVECLDNDENWLYNGIVDKILNFDDIVVNRDILAVIYRYIRRIAVGTLSFPDMFVHARILENETKNNINFFKFFIALLVFDELELMELSLEKDGSYKIVLFDDAKKVDLENSEILDWIRDTAASLE